MSDEERELVPGQPDWLRSFAESCCPECKKGLIRAAEVIEILHNAISDHNTTVMLTVNSMATCLVSGDAKGFSSAYQLLCDSSIRLMDARLEAMEITDK